MPAQSPERPRAIDNQPFAAVTGLIFDRLAPRLTEAVRLGGERYPDDDAAQAAWVCGAIYGAAASFLLDNAAPETEVTPDHIDTLFVGLCELADEVFSDENQGDINRALERLVPDAFGKED